MNCRHCDQPFSLHLETTIGRLCPNQGIEGVNDVVADEYGEDNCTRYSAAYPAYANVYCVEQAYGGPEEGGWWYDVGTPLESISVESAEEHAATLARLRAKYELDEDNRYAPADESNIERERQRGRTSAAGGYDVRIFREYEFAKPFPTTRQTYC